MTISRLWVFLKSLDFGSHQIGKSRHFSYVSISIRLGVFCALAIILFTLFNIERGAQRHGLLATPAIAAGNQPPIAHAGQDQTAAVGAVVQLDGTASTEPDGSRITYQWTIDTLPGGSQASLSDPTLPRPTFVVDIVGTYEFSLIATEGPRSSPPDIVVISTTNSRPHADAGQGQTVPTGGPIILDGSKSTDPDGNLLMYSWVITSLPAGSTATLDDSAAVRPGFTADLSGEYVLELQVSDGSLQSDVSTVTVSTTNSASVGVAGTDETVTVGDSVRVDAGESHDRDEDEVSLDWALIRRPDGSSAKITKPSEDRPSLNVDVPGDYVVQLRIGDGTADDVLDTKMVSTGNVAPVAIAGQRQQVMFNQIVQLDGATSYDVNGDELAISWALIAKPATSLAILSDPAALRPNFLVDVPGD